MPRDTYFESFKDHTLLKHFLLSAYLKIWASILSRGGFRRMWFVDAFAGAGRDKTGKPGSPVIAAEIARGINVAHFPGSSDGMRILAIEENPVRYAELLTQMEPYGDVAQVRDGRLDLERAKQWIAYTNKMPSLFFIDPFGVDGLDASILPVLLAGPHNEVLALFADEGAKRLFGKAMAEIPTFEDELEAARRDPSILGAEHDAELEADARESVMRTIAGHKSNPRAEEILNTAFGDSRWQEIPEAERQEKLVDLYEQLLRKSGATYVLRFAVTTMEGRHKYYLLHASKSKRAFAAMKEAMHRTRRKRKGDLEADQPPLFRSAGEDVEMTRITDVVASVAAHFAKRGPVRFTGDYSAETIERFVIDETPLFPHELPALREALTARGWGTMSAKGKLKKPWEFTFSARAVAGEA